MSLSGELQTRPCSAFAMPGGIACNDRQSGQQKVKNFVGDREIATSAVFHLPGKADVMFSKGETSCIGHTGLARSASLA